jgi:transcriptional regulator with XRE-family HTH domain
MKFKDKYNIAPEFESLFTSKSKEDELEHEAKMIMFRFLSELEKLNSEKPLKKKDLAKAINTSASYITQLYRGDKLANLLTLAKIQEAYNLTFEIKAKLNSENYSEEHVKFGDKKQYKEMLKEVHLNFMKFNKK